MTNATEYYEDQDYERYFNEYDDGEGAWRSAIDEWDATDDLLEADEISDAEEGFLRGYRRW